MPNLFEELKQSALEWRNEGYPHDTHPLIGEILSYQTEKQESEISLRFLREPQFLALEVYWYVRLVLKTPPILDIYKRYYENDKKEFFSALGIPMSKDALDYAEIDDVIKKVKENENFVNEKKLQALNESLNLDYPSYILALAMGAGKTVLIGAIIATEFAMSLRYPDGNFMKNALVFAPGTTIIESLRELSDMSYEKILPPDLNRDFLANLKIEFVDKGKDIQTQRGSIYNMIVTNTERISLRAERNSKQKELTFREKELQANLRLQKIASLPKLGVFSDEAHHTYGNRIVENEIKRVRATINYIHENTPIVAVVNTTGTPYYKRQTLKEVIVWYGLKEGIEDNILKNMKGGVHQYSMRDQPDAEVFNDIIREFFESYGDVSLPDGARAKIAFYFKSQEHLEQSKQLIETAMTKIRQDVSQILVNTQTSHASQIDEFKRLNNPDNQKRVILLISKGVEGWNCPSLFACALIKEQTASNNYVLQAATRCLRQVPGNEHSAKVFLDDGNTKILERQLQENFNANLDDFRLGDSNKETVTVRILKTELKLPKLEITRTVKRAVRAKEPGGNINLKRPKAKQVPAVLRSTLTPDFAGPGEILLPTGEMRELPAGKRVTDCHTAAWKISSRYHLPIVPILSKIQGIYPKGEVLESHLYELFLQIEKQQANYKTVEEKITEVLALIRTQDENGEDIFERDEEGVFVHHLRLLKSTFERMEKDDLFAKSGKYKDKHDLSFHYDPYNFDSKPEQSLFKRVLEMLNTNPDDVETFLFTGGLTDTKKTDFHFEYLGEDGRYHDYFPDFVIVKKSGEFLIVEVKAEDKRGDATVKAKNKAVEKLRGLQPDKFKYEIVYTPADTVAVKDMKCIKDWVGL